MANELKGKKIAVLAANFFEQVELTKPLAALKEAGAEVKVVSPDSGQIQGMNHADKGDKIKVDLTLDEANAQDFDAIMIPGGTMNPDSLRSSKPALEFVKQFFRTGKPAALICHAPWVLIDAELADGRTLTSWPAIQTDLKNAGAHWIDEDVVVDNGLVTSRKPDDIPAFVNKMIEEFGEGKHTPAEKLVSGREAPVTIET